MRLSPKDYPMAIAMLIKRKRETLGLSKSEAAEKCGVTLNQLYEYEHGAIPRKKTVEKIKSGLKIQTRAWDRMMAYVKKEPPKRRYCIRFKRAVHYKDGHYSNRAFAYKQMVANTEVTAHDQKEAIELCQDRLLNVLRKIIKEKGTNHTASIAHKQVCVRMDGLLRFKYCSFTATLLH